MSRPSQSEARTRLVEVLGDSVYHALGLKESLLTERQALENQDTALLQQCVDAKGLCITKLAELERQRAGLCESSGFSAGPEQMQAMSNWCDEDTVVADCWSHLMEIATDCNQLNLTNGATIRLRQHHTENSLAVLRGTDRNDTTYGRSGSDLAGRNQRSLAEA